MPIRKAGHIQKITLIHRALCQKKSCSASLDAHWCICYKPEEFQELVVSRENECTLMADMAQKKLTARKLPRQLAGG
jgi:hypothetical protein